MPDWAKAVAAKTVAAMEREVAAAAARIAGRGPRRPLWKRTLFGSGRGLIYTAAAAALLWATMDDDTKDRLSHQMNAIFERRL